MVDPEALGYATPADLSTPRLPNHPATVSLLCCIIYAVAMVIGVATGANSGSSNTAADIPFLFACILPPVFAIFFGIIGLVIARDGRYAGKDRSIVGICCGGIILLLMFAGFLPIGPSIGYAREAPNRAKCARILKQLGGAIEAYANENKGVYPANFADLMLSQDIPAEFFICPSTNDDKATGVTPEQRAASLSTKGHNSYIYLGAGKSANTPANAVLIYEPLTNHQQNGMNVLFADFHVQFIAKPLAQKIEAELKAGQNPPPSYH
jgi:prepilin-type processing-associated H-X9-DG protein